MNYTTEQTDYLDLLDTKAGLALANEVWKDGRTDGREEALAEKSGIIRPQTQSPYSKLLIAKVKEENEKTNE